MLHMIIVGCRSPFVIVVAGVEMWPVLCEEAIVQGLIWKFNYLIESRPTFESRPTWQLSHLVTCVHESSWHNFFVAPARYQVDKLKACPMGPVRLGGEIHLRYELELAIYLGVGGGGLWRPVSVVGVVQCAGDMCRVTYLGFPPTCHYQRQVETYVVWTFPGVHSLLEFVKIFHLGGY